MYNSLLMSTSQTFWHKLLPRSLQKLRPEMHYQLRLTQVYDAGDAMCQVNKGSIV